MGDLARSLRAGAAPPLRATSVLVVPSGRDPRLGRPLALAIALAGAVLAVALLVMRRRALLVAAAGTTAAAAVIAWSTWRGATFNLPLHLTAAWLALPVAAVALRSGWIPWLALAIVIVAAIPVAHLSVTPSSPTLTYLARAAAFLVPASAPVALVAALLSSLARRVCRALP